MYVNTYSHYAVYIISIKPTIVHLLLSPISHVVNMKSEISIILFIYAIIDMVLHHEIGLYHHGIRSYLFILTTYIRHILSVLSECPPSIYAIRCVSLFNHPSILRSPPSHLPTNLTYHVMHAVCAINKLLSHCFVP
eukprot:360128_1